MAVALVCPVTTPLTSAKQDLGRESGTCGGTNSCAISICQTQAAAEGGGAQGRR